MPEQLTLFDVPAKPRRPPRVLGATLVDAGYIDGTGECIQPGAAWPMRCGVTSLTTWVPETKARPPCPRCATWRGRTDECRGLRQPITRLRARTCYVAQCSDDRREGARWRTGVYDRRPAINPPHHGGRWSAAASLVEVPMSEPRDGMPHVQADGKGRWREHAAR